VDFAQVLFGMLPEIQRVYRIRLVEVRGGKRELRAVAPMGAATPIDAVKLCVRVEA
jgi:hypothetical protein